MVVELAVAVVVAVVVEVEVAVAGGVPFGHPCHPKISTIILITLPGGTVSYPAKPGLIRQSVSLSVSLCVHACILGILRKKAQVRQMWSIIL